MKVSNQILLAVIAAFAANGASATEGGGSSYPIGSENFMSGAAPPPGFYIMEYLTHYQADKLKDNSGNDVPLPVFKLRVDVAATRLVYSTPFSLLGGNVLYQAFIPVIDQKITLPGLSKSNLGVSDVTLGAAIAHHFSPNLHSVMAMNVVVPVGSYDKDRAVNAGRNYWALQPVYTMTYVDPTGFNGDFLALWNFNQKNSATQYKSGNEFVLDYAAGWGVGNGFTVGVSGYMLRQFTDDKSNGATVADNRTSGMSIGPSVKWDNGHHWFITVKWEKEMEARNRPQGNQLWIKTLIPI